MNALIIAVLIIGCSGKVAHMPSEKAVDANAFSPFPVSGRLIFLKWSGENQGIYALDIRAGVAKYLTEKLPYDNDFVLSADGQVIAFTSSVEEVKAIFTLDSKGTDLQQLTSSKVSSHSPTWSPDGNQIAFTAFVGDTEQIFITDINGANVRQLTFGDSRSYAPLWSPSGEYIIFKSEISMMGTNIHQSQRAFIMKSDGSSQKLLVDNFVNSILWYPDNEIISVSVPESRFMLRTYAVNIDGKIQHKLPALVTDGVPIWSPTREFVLFEHLHASEINLCANFAVIKPDSLESCFLIDRINSSIQTISPSWSPDGDYVVFSSNLDGDYDIYIVETDGSNLVQLTNMPGDESFPVWTH